MTSNVGVIGLGAMGSGMAGSLRRHGSQVHVFDVHPEVAQAFAAEGGVACASPAEMGAQCDVIVSVVVNAAQTESVLQGQCRHQVGLIDYKVVAQGEAAIRTRIDQLRAQGVGLAIVDAISNDDLLRLGPALKNMPLVTAGSGVAIGLPANFGIAPSSTASALPEAAGLQAVVSGSCSLATNRQVLAFVKAGLPARSVDPLQVAAGVDVVAQMLAWAKPLLGQGPVLIYSSADSNAVKAVQAQLGVEEAGALLERTLAAIARGLVDVGVRQLVLAGGETSGACVQALNITQMKIGPQIDPGVPWCHAQTDAAPQGGLHLTLKSGNFGTDDFFIKAFARLV